MLLIVIVILMHQNCFSQVKEWKNESQHIFYVQDESNSERTYLISCGKSSINKEDTTSYYDYTILNYYSDPITALPELRLMQYEAKCIDTLLTYIQLRYLVMNQE